MSSISPSNTIPLLTPNRVFSGGDEVQHHWRSVRLDFSFECGFKASVLCSDAKGQKYGDALVETKSIVLGSFKEQLKRMASKEIENYLLYNFTLQIEKLSSGAFKVLIGLKSSSSQTPQVRSTGELATQLRLLSIDHPHYIILQGIALAAVEEFSRTQNKTKPLIDEVTALASAHNTTITRALLKTLIKEIKQNELLDIDLLIALSTTLVNAYIEAIDADDLIQMLIIVNERMARIHKQDKTSYKLYAVLSVMTDILDLMSDANVVEVSRTDLHNPLYNTLEGLSRDGQQVIAAQAAYGQQALVRLPNDESKFSAF